MSQSFMRALKIEVSRLEPPTFRGHDQAVRIDAKRDKKDEDIHSNEVGDLFENN